MVLNAQQVILLLPEGQVGQKLYLTYATFPEKLGDRVQVIFRGGNPRDQGDTRQDGDSAIFGALGQSNINVIAIAQGSSEYSISIVVAAQDAEAAMRQIHREVILNGD